MDEQPARLCTRLVVTEPAHGASKLLQLPDGSSSFLMQWHEPLTLALPDWYAETRGSIRVCIEAIKVQVPDLAPAGTAPARYDQCRALKGANKPSHRGQKLVELLCRDIARDALGPLR